MVKEENIVVDKILSFLLTMIDDVQLTTIC